MPIVDFSTYTLNNDNAECGYVLVFDCTLGNFVFINPCDLLTGCHINMNDHIDWDTFDRCKMVDSPLLNDMEPGYFLRVNLAGTCIEGVDPASLSRLHDYRVRCTAADHEEYLQQKVVGTTGRILVSLIPGVNQHLKIDIDPAFETSILPANPSCVDATYNPTGYAQLVYDTALGVHRECQQNRGDVYWFQRYLNSDITIQTGDTGFPAGGSTLGACYWFVRAQGGDGLQSMNYTFVPTVGDGFFAPMVGQNIPAIEIQESGVYAVWANVDFEITTTPAEGDSAIEAIRFFLYTNNGKTMLLNMKEANHPHSLCPAPTPPSTIATTTRTFTGYNQVYMKKGEYLFMGLRVYTPDPAKTFTLIIKSQALDLENPYPTNPAGKLSGTTFGCALVSKSIQDAS